MESIRIIALCVVAAVVYGIVHDQVTVRVCVEYFTIGHPPVFVTDSPTVLAIGWGIIATWWVGLGLGVPAALVARAGSRPKRTARSLVRPIGILLLVMGVGALVFGVCGYFAARGGVVFLVGSIAERVPADRHDVFIADLWAHLASYGIGFVGGIVLMVIIWRSRKTLASNAT